MDTNNQPQNNRKAMSNLGNMLLSMGKITTSQLDEALAIQKKTKEKLDEIIIKLGFCTEQDIAVALSLKYGYRVLSLNDIGIDMTAANLITPEKAIKYNLLPVMKDEKTLYVAMKNPDDIIAIDDLRILTGYNIMPIIVTGTELNAAINNFVNSSRNLSIKEDMEENDAIGDGENINDNDDSTEKPAVSFVNQILTSAVKANASDIHVEPQEKHLRVRFRIDGVLHEITQQPQRMQAAIISRIKIIGSMDIAERRIPQDGRATFKLDDLTIDMRIASLPSVYGERITIRLLPRSSRVITVNDLGFSDRNAQIINEAVDLPYGFILVTGPTGSGKSTTLYALLMRVNKEDKNIITLEDPVERRFAGLNQVQMNNRAGMTFSSGLRSILRSDPDIIMIGEVRDTETAKIAVESALTGHFVLSTLHTNDSASSITRLSEMGVDRFLTASSVVAVVAQRLVRVLCKQCKEAYVYKKIDLKELIPDFPFDEGSTDEDEITIYKANSCIACNGTGYSGRRGAYEILKVTPAIQQLILEGVSADKIKQLAIQEGMLTLRNDGLLKVKDGITSYEEMVRVII